MHSDIEHSSLLPSGFKVAGVAAGVKANGDRDLGLVVSEEDCSAAGVFTTNRVCAAPVELSREHIANGSARAIVVNAGNANACTGTRGMTDARSMARHAAQCLELEEQEVLVCSTGSIGQPLPMDAVLAGIAAAAKEPGADHGDDFAAAILTTDLVPKYATVTVPAGDSSVRITGIVKGSGMIEPNMATMLAFIMTDAAVAAHDLQAALTEAVQHSFNRISVDGDQSTNDTVLLLANGEHSRRITPGHSGWDPFVAALRALCLDLALQIVRDGEGAKHLITLKVSGAASDAEAETAARAVAHSFLVKTAWTGTYPAWGRILAAFGSCGIAVDPDQVSIDYDALPIVRNGLAAPDTRAEQVLEITRKPAYTIRAKLGAGRGESLVYTCDCSEEYVRINME